VVVLAGCLPTLCWSRKATRLFVRVIFSEAKQRRPSNLGGIHVHSSSNPMKTFAGALLSLRVVTIGGSAPAVGSIKFGFKESMRPQTRPPKTVRKDRSIQSRCSLS